MSTLSIIIPTYNNVRGLSQNITQFNNQKNYDETSVDFIISDDSENDDVLNYVSTIRSNFKGINYQKGPQSGAVNNWNECLKQISSKYLLFMHHDEYVLSEFFLNKIIIALERDDNDVFILPLLKERNGGFVKHYPNRLKLIFILFPSLIFMCNAFGPPSVMIIKSNITEEFDSNLKWFVDVEWYYRILKKRPKTKVLNEREFQIVSDLNFDGSITKKLDILKLRPREQKYIMKNIYFPDILFTAI